MLRALLEAMRPHQWVKNLLLFVPILVGFDDIFHHWTHAETRVGQPGYDAETHFGGVLYLYLRGMCGPETPVVDGQPCGVFSWRPPGELVAALSDVLESGESPCGDSLASSLRGEASP